jgi:hypothetical protein
MRAQDCPECRWVPVVDGSGRRRLEMRWQLPVPAATSAAVPLSRAA